MAWVHGTDDPVASATFEADDPLASRSLRTPILVARWVFVVAVCYAVLLGASAVVPQGTRELFVVAILAANVVATWALRERDCKRTRWLVTMLDVAAVSSAILLVRNAATEFFLAYFVVLTFAALSHGAVAAGFVSLIVSVVYGGLLYNEVGGQLLSDSQFLVRVGFLCGVGFFFGIVADEAKRHRDRAREIARRKQSVAFHAKTLARDKYRLRALSEIGRLGLAGSATAGRDVLYEISKRVQKGVGVDRCSLIVFGREEGRGYLAASSDDDSVEVRTLPVDRYPELQETLASGEITEVHPNRPLELWQRIREFLPNVSSFNSFLVVPIKAGERVFGAFYLRDHDPEREFDDEERDFCWAAALMTASFIRGRDLLEQLREQSRVDGLTGLLNFQAFTQELHRELSAGHAQRVAPYTLVVVDMDNLKEVNDRYGHMAGNRAITELGRHLRAALPDALAMCRYGGDEFVSLVNDGKKATALRLDAMLRQLEALEWDAPFRVRASVGVAEFPADGATPEALLEAADQAMYLAKGNGGQQIRLADADRDKGEIYEAVVQVQTRRLVPEVQEAFKRQLDALQRRSVLGLQAPVVKEAVAALVDAVESQDPYGRKHSEQVSRLARGLAQQLELAPAQVLRVEIAAHLHDVGKIKLPPELLTKSGPLSPEERRMVQQVPEAGARILESLPGLRGVAELVRTYQERWDGSGYPRGLAGDAIPLGAQIIGICDAYNAMVSPRAQRPAMTREEARAAIEAEIGTSWNPRVARVFLSMLASRFGAGLIAGQSAVSAPDTRAVGA